MSTLEDGYVAGDGGALIPTSALKINKVAVDIYAVEEPPAYSLYIDDIAKQHGVNVSVGLSTEEAERRLVYHGPNELKGRIRTRIAVVVCSQVATAISVVMTAATVLALVGRDYVEAGVILFCMITNMFIGIVHSYKADKTMFYLRRLTSPSSVVIRSGKELCIPGVNLVPGDIILLRTGDTVSADCRLFESQMLTADEAILTGETHGVEKSPSKLAGQHIPIPDQANMLFASTTITQGHGKAIVIRTGINTQIGNIARKVASVKNDRPTHLQVSLKHLVTGTICISAIMALVIFARELWIYKPEVGIYAVSVAIAIIPEGMVAVMTLTMALGVRKMSAQRVLVRKLAVLEKLGSVTNICSDKTGTLTQGKMTVNKVWLPDDTEYDVEAHGFDPIAMKISGDNSRLGRIGACAVFCNTAELNFNHGSWNAFGDPTEIALLIFARKLQQEKYGYQFLAEYSFDPSLKRMTVIYQGPEHTVAFSKGATDRILERCVKIRIGDEDRAVSYWDLEQLVMPQLRKFASESMRVMALASRTIDKDLGANAVLSLPRGEIESKLTFLGLIGIRDAARPESRQSVERCHAAGIKVHMLTGDHELTAEAVARTVGILRDGDDARDVMTATDFDSMTDTQIDHLDHLPIVLTRCTPHTKVRMIEALHRRNKVVAMTGDGVNDSPSLKLADIGIAMGSGSDIAKQASDIVLTDDNFAYIVDAIAEGRRTFRNVQRCVAVLIAGNMAKLVALAIGLAFSDRDGDFVGPLSAVQILVQNMITGTPSALALSVGKASPINMQLPPRPVNLGLFDTELAIDIVFYGAVMGLISVFDYYLVLFWIGSGDLGSNCAFAVNSTCTQIYRARGVTFTVSTLLLLLHTHNCRSFHGSMWSISGLKAFAENVHVLHAICAGSTIVLISLYFPFLNTEVFGQLGFGLEWIMVVISVLVFIVLSELYKFVKKSIKLSISQLYDKPSKVKLTSFQKIYKSIRHV